MPEAAPFTAHAQGVDPAEADSRRRSSEAKGTPIKKPPGATSSNTGPRPLEAAQQAVDRGVWIDTVGFGESHGSIPFDGGFGGGAGGGGFGGGSFGGGFRTGIDKATLKQIAEMTGGMYYSATSAGELESVFQKLPTYRITRHELMELSVAFTALGALLAVAAMLLSMRWQPLP